jgi:beta-lactamase regulating signal transducer with metallopeptidase domain
MGAYLTVVVLYLAAASWQIAVLTAAVAAATFALRHRSAHVRHLLWLIVVAKCLVPPLYAVPLPVLPPAEHQGPLSVLPPPWRPDGATVVHPVPPDTLRPLQKALPFHTAPALGARQPAGAAVGLAPLGWIAGILWLIGAGGYLTMNLLRALRGHAWLWKTRSPLPEEARAEAADLLRTYGARRVPRIWLTEGVGQPFVWGLVRGSIYVPPSLLSLESPAHRRDVLAHELSHVLRCDAAVNVLQVVAQGLFWFHPFVWWANHKIRQEREKCCDEMVIARLHTTPKDYSTAIVETLARARESARPVPSLAVASPLHSIEARIRTILRPGGRFRARPSLGAAMSVVLVALVAVSTTLVLSAKADKQPVAAGESEPDALPGPLAQFPRSLNGWTGEDLEIAPAIAQYMRTNFADDFINRRYMNAEAGQCADLYVVSSSSRPAGILGHDARVCYPANGWIWDQTVPAHIVTSSNRVVRCVMHRFHLPPGQAGITVLCFYVMDGKIMSEQNLPPRLVRETAQRPPRYVAMVQICSHREDSVRSAAGAMADTLVDTLAIRAPSMTAVSRTERPAGVESGASDGYSRQSGSAPVTFNSQMAFDVFAKDKGIALPDLERGEPPAQPMWMGHTPSTTPLEIPADWVWWVAPASPVQDWDLLIQEVDRHGIPGLRLSQLTGTDLEHLAKLSGLKYLDLIAARVTDAGLAHLRGLTQLQWLSLQGTEVTPTSMVCLADMTDLQILDLSHTGITDAGVAHLKDLTSLRCLSLQDNRITDAGLEHLEGLAKLQLLDLLETRITDAGLAHLADLPQLQALLLGSPGIAGSGLAYLKNMPRLRGLVLAGTGVTDAGLAHLEGMTGLQGLALAGPQITDASLAHLQGLAGLRALDLEDTQITDAGLAVLGSLTQLQWLDLTSDKITDTGLEQLRGLTGLKRLSTRGKQITLAAEQRLKQALPNLATD